MCRTTDNEVIELYRRLGLIALREYSHIVIDIEVREDKLRIYLIDGSFLDVWFSRRKPGKYAFHWERRHIDGTIYRWDNAAHKRAQNIPTYPHHVHEGSQFNLNPSNQKTHGKTITQDNGLHPKEVSKTSQVT